MPHLLALVFALAAACAPATPTPAAPTNHAGSEIARRVVIRHGLMTYVMDSTAGQRDKARRAIDDSRLVQELTDRRYQIEIRFDPTAGDAVIVEAADGRELGRADLHDIAGGAAPAAILDPL